jgi:predicted DNA-binding protein with PD1-like motif
MNGSVASFRLLPGTDLRAGIEAASRKRRLGAVAIVTCVGSLSHARLRLAQADRVEDVPGPLEIVSLAGTISPSGAHLHAAVADAEGRVTGGHLAYGSLVHTTAEVVVIEDVSALFDRVFDPNTGYRELTIRKRRKR